jgi:tetratricopeptide (TPR) repeat protein
LGRPLLVVALLAGVASPGSSPVGAQVAPRDETFAQASRRALAEGRVADAQALAKARPAGDADAAAVLARIAQRTGDYDRALHLLQPAAAAHPASDAALELGLLQQYLGHRDEAQRTLGGVLNGAGRGGDVEGLYRAAQAGHALRRAYDANAIFQAVTGASQDPAIEQAWGRLFLDTYNRAEALKSFKTVLERDPRWAPALLGIAETLADENAEAAADAATKAIAIDPQLAGAYLALARMDLDNTKFDSARERVQQVLAFNPNSLEAQALLAGIAFVRDGRAAFDAEAAKALAINPKYGEVYRVAAEIAARNYRFDDAVALTREAVALDPENSRAYADLGLHLLRTGDEAEARKALDRSVEQAGLFDLVTKNLLDLLDKLDTFQVVTDGDLTFKFAPEEAPVLRQYAIPLAHEALRALSAKYEFTPQGPLLVEIFPQHDDFAVRTLGLPGMLGALGACFGRVVTLDSPHAREPGTFSWQATLWHELTHVITLQMSNQRVPRWLTEGLSVYEEAQARPQWGRDMEVSFAIALERGQVLKLRDLNSGFTKAETIGLAYYEASLLADHIVRTHGQEAIGKLLRTYGQGVEGDEAIQQGLGVSIDELQASFDRALDDRFGAMRAALRAGLANQARPGGDDVATLKLEASRQPGSYQAQLALGQALAEAGDAAAYEPLEKAAALIPVAAGESSPHAVMGALAEKLGDSARAIREYRELLANDHTAVAPARRLAALAEKAGDRDALLLAYTRVVELDPFDPAAHVGLGRLALQQQDAATAIREFTAAIASGAADRAAAHCDLGEAYLLGGRAADAKKEALAALEIAPSFERAQDLLLKTVDAKGAVEGGR